MAVRFQDVTKRYRERAAVREFTLQVPAGERVVLLGPSGCGKTTVLRLLAGLVPPDRGQIDINDEIVAMDGRNLREPQERGLGMVFQDLALWPHLTVSGNLEFGLKAQGVPAIERRNRIEETLERMQLQGYADTRPAELSGGQQQRTALARALVLNPKLLLMDEPLSSLDFELNFQLRQELLRLQGELGFTLIYVTHSLEEAFDIATRIVVMKDGRIERIGDVSDIRAHFQQRITTMNARALSKIAALSLLLLSSLWDLPAVWAEGQTIDTAKIEQLTGVKGKLNNKEGVFKVAVPRSDLKVTVAGMHMTPPMGLTSWAAFSKDGEKTLVMGDLVLLEDQVSPVMSVALDNGLEVTALHNHFLWENPRVMFMHIGGRGDEDTLAAAIGKVFAKIKESSEGKAQALHAELDPAKTSLDQKKIEGILGVPGEMTDGVYKVTWGRTTKMGEHAIGNAMGVNTWAAFVGSDAQAVVDGDFAMYEGELQSVLKALRTGGIHIVAIHSHMSMESPKVAFLHYWGIGSTTELAKALQSALDTQRKNPMSYTAYEEESDVS